MTDLTVVTDQYHPHMGWSRSFPSSSSLILSSPPGRTCLLVHIPLHCHGKKKSLVHGVGLVCTYIIIIIIILMFVPIHSDK